MINPVKEITLENGLTVLIIQDESTPVISLKAYVKAGSMTEHAHFGAGLSHFVEHIVAGGSTEKHTENEYKQFITTMGGAYNAYTTIDHTCYYINTTQEHTKKGLHILHEWLFHCLFKDTEVAREREVITREIERSNANISRKFYQASQENFFKAHPIKYPVIGYLDNFKELNREHLLDYYRELYIPTNMVLSLCGNLDLSVVLKTIQTLFGKEKKKAPFTPTLFKEPPPFSDRYFEKEAETQTTFFSMRFATTSLFSKDLAALDILDFILGNGNQSLLHQELVEKKKLAYFIASASFTPCLTTGYLEISAEIDYKNVEKVKACIVNCLERIKKGDLPQRLIEKAIKQKRAEDILAISTVEDLIVKHSLSYLYTSTTHFFARYLEAIKKTTKKQCMAVANKYLNLDKMVITILKPKHTSTTKKTAKKKKESQENAIELVTLPNGLRVLLKSDSSYQKVFTQLFTLGGVRHETEKNNGIGAIFSDCLGKASEKHNKTTLQNFFEEKGAILNSNIGNNTLYSSLSMLSEDFKTLFPIYNEMLLHARFPNEEIEEAKRKAIQWINQRQDDWHRYAYYQFKKSFYNEHPYSLSSSGELQSVATIDKKKLEGYYQSLFSPNQTIISIMGGFDRDLALSQIESTYGVLSKSADNNLRIQNRQQHQKKTQTHISLQQDVGAVLVGYDGTTFKDKLDFIKLDLLNTVLSGISYPNGRLHTILREKGLVYSVYATNQPGIETGHFLITALTNKDTIPDVTDVIFKEIQKIQTDIVSEAEFEQAIAQIRFYYQEKISGLEPLSVMVSTDELYARGHSFYSEVLKIGRAHV